MDESTVQQEIQIQGPHHRCLLLRNNSGACTDKDGRLVRFGLGNISKRHQNISASSDLIGITMVTITSDMVGRQVGIFTAIEVKRPDWKRSRTNKREIAQLNFINWVKSCGGFGGFANSVDTFKKILGV